MQERIKELELRYKYFLLKKYLKYLFLIVLILVITFCFFMLMQKYNKQKNIYLQAIEHKKHLEQKILQAQILQEKNKISREKLYKELEEVKAVQENTHISKIEIDSKILNISDLKKSFYRNPSYEKALNLAKKYFDIKVYQKTIFWALKANELDKQKQDSWLIFAQAKRALGEEKEAQSALDAYINYYGLMELDGK
ncbi:TPA: transformation system protein [Campylobacter jejuni]|uniref:transformation system protein n=1 Tax=Campylobacter jejuni TaxID=197 RepID=UPI00069BD1EA|nr:transformation system protein [Campylobacter jejuni]ECP9346012.1 transformation system protein [Campylobacter jejuni]RTJ09189.1 transformation system protein [Campylobacter jejuni]RTJ50072.1 transformation system protein [Campylobacter jejuni]HEF3288243.1 transformation system protein [Campylobacter jejuni]HEF3798072.1 transformation system protein [Campylobacter jejuni]